MAKKLQLSIPEPCHENWDAMTPVEKGRYCGSCQKQVVDFSMMSDRQVAEFFKKPSTGSVCGRFMTDQLERDIEIPKKRIPWFKYFFQFALPAFLVSIKASSARAQGEIKIKTAIAKDTTTHPVCTDRLMGKPAIRPAVVEERGLKGKVLDAQTNQPLPRATVIMVSSLGRENVNLKQDGSFVLNTIRKISFYRVEVLMPGYLTQVIEQKDIRPLPDGSMVVLLHKEIMIRGQIVVITKNPALDELKNTIQLKVVDERGEVIPYASIVTDVIGKGGAANKDGEFDLDKSTLNSNGHVFVSSAGYERKEIPVKTLSAVTGSFTIQLQNKTWMPVVVVSTYVLGGITRIKAEPVTVINKTDKKDSVVKKEMDNTKFIAYPNPVTGGSIIHISCKDFVEGNYHFEVLNLAGQVIRQSELRIDKKTFLFDVTVPASSSAGTYFIVLIDRISGKKYTEKIIIQ